MVISGLTLHKDPYRTRFPQFLLVEYFCNVLQIFLFNCVRFPLFTSPSDVGMNFLEMRRRAFCFLWRPIQTKRTTERGRGKGFLCPPFYVLQTCINIQQ